MKMFNNIIDLIMSERTLTIKGSSPHYEGTVTAHFAGKISGRMEKVLVWRSDKKGWKTMELYVVDVYDKEIIDTVKGKPIDITPEFLNGYVAEPTTTDIDKIYYCDEKPPKGEPCRCYSLAQLAAGESLDVKGFTITNTGAGEAGEAVAEAQKTLSAMLGDVASAETEVKMRKAAGVASVFTHKGFQSIIAEI